MFVKHHSKPIFAFDTHDSSFVVLFVIWLGIFGDWFLWGEDEGEREGRERTAHANQLWLLTITQICVSISKRFLPKSTFNIKTVSGTAMARLIHRNFSYLSADVVFWQANKCSWILHQIRWGTCVSCCWIITRMPNLFTHWRRAEN